MLSPEELKVVIAEAEDKARKYPHLPCGCKSLGNYYERLAVELKKILEG